MSSIENTNDISVLRRRLQAVEEEIIRIAKPFDHIMSDAEEELVSEHLLTRSYILNRMFELHATEAEVQRFEEVNERLFNLTKDFNKRHQQLQQQLSSICTLSGEPLELQTELEYHRRQGEQRQANHCRLRREDAGIQELKSAMV